MKFQTKPGTDPVLRSLLIKAVRRANGAMVRRAFNALILGGDLDWVKKRIFVETYECCWPLGSALVYTSDVALLMAQYLTLANTIKNREACGLGILAYQLSEGADERMLEGLTPGETEAVRTVCAGLKDPRPYWADLLAWRSSPDQGAFIQAAWTGSKKASWPWDKSFSMASAQLARLRPIPAPLVASQTPAMEDADAFPLWVAADKHTAPGKAAIREAAKHSGFSYREGIWTSLFFESLTVNQETPSAFMQRDATWRLQKLNLNVAQGHAVWQTLAPLVKAHLEPTVELLKRKLGPL
jgi:hypothetical protein